MTAPAASGVGVELGEGLTPTPVGLRVIGVDLSLSSSGMSDGRTTWTVRSHGDAGASLYERDARLRQIRAEVLSHCENATLVIMEGPSLGSVHGHQHDRSGLFWMVVRALRHRGIDVAEVAPTVVKKYATGSGAASKGAVIDAASRRVPHVDTAGDDNRADSLWLHLIGVAHLTGVHVVPESHRVALGKVRWPALAGER